MSIFSIVKTYRNISRMRRIVQVLSKYGFGHLVLRMNMARVPLLSRIGRIPKSIEARTSTQDFAMRARMVLEDLGATFVKLGQILSYRPDLVPEEFIEEFKKLQDAVPPFPAEEAKKAVSEAIGHDWSEAFKSFDDEPIGAGSIGQAHKARLSDGTDVIVKVKRPGVEMTIRTDLRILFIMANLAEQYIPESRVYRPIVLVEEFSRQLDRELDFVTEAASTARFSERYSGKYGVRIPKIFWEYSSKDVMCVEQLSGVNAGDIESLKAAGVDLKKVAQSLADAFMYQFFESGLFHGDPHPGNILIGADGSIGLLDFGLVGHLTEDIRGHIGTLILGIFRRDVDLIVEVYRELGIVSEGVAVRDLKTDVLELLDRYFGMPIGRIDTGEVFMDIVRLARRHQAVLPRDFVLLCKSLVAVTSLVRSLDPDFNIADAAGPHAKALIREKYSYGHVMKSASATGRSVADMLKKLPGDLAAIMRLTRSGKVRLNLAHDGTERFFDEIERSSNRVSLSMILASMVVGSALVMRAGVGPHIIKDLPLLGVAGFTISALFGVLLALSILRSGKI